MIEVPVYKRSGEKAQSIMVDESALGGFVRRRLLREAVLMYEANRRQGTKHIKSKSEKAGTGKKLFRQKHTGRARVGMPRAPHRRGGGRAWSIDPKDWSYDINYKARKKALQASVLGKARDGELLVVEELEFARPKTREMASFLSSLGVEDSCLLVTESYDENVLKSARNLPHLEVRELRDLNAYDVLRHRHLVMTRKAAEKFLGV